MLFPTKYSSSLDLYSPGTLYRDGKSTIKRHLFLKATSPVPPALTITVLWPKAELPPKESYIPRERDPIPASIHRFFDLNLNSLMKFSPALADINVAVNYVYYVLIDPFLQYPEHFLTPSREGIRNLLEGDEGAGIRELLMSCCLQRAYTRIRRLGTCLFSRRESLADFDVQKSSQDLLVHSLGLSI